MRQYLKNAQDFSSECALTEGQCTVARENFAFIDEALEHLAIARLQLKCGQVVITPDAASSARCWLYQTSCARMGDVVEQVFAGLLQAAVEVAQPSVEMSMGALQRRALVLAYADCRKRVAAFEF